MSLVKPGGLVVDQLSYPEQVPNRSYSRFQDGVNGFVVTQAPTPGASNTDNGLVGPRVSFEGLDLARMAPGVPIRLFARAKDDVGIVNLSLLWRRLDFPDMQTRRVVLYDDGLHGDGGSQDGWFSGEMPEGLELGAEIQFYLECTDLSGEVDTAPSGPRFVNPGQHPLVYSMAVGGARPDLEISEVVARNRDSLRDEHGNSPDWVEIRNPTEKAVSLAGISLARAFGGAGGEFVFTNTVLLKPGEHWVIYMDGKSDLGEFHAPFKLDADGGTLVLMGRSKNGAQLLLDSVRYEAQSPDVALMRLGRGGPWVTGKPTPRSPNVLDSLRGLWSGTEFVLAYPTQLGRTYSVEFTDDLAGNAWSVMRRVSGLGFEQTVSSNAGTRRFFWVREE